jgi:hypothetical protein
VKRFTLLVVAMTALLSFSASQVSASTAGGLKLAGPYNNLCRTSWQPNGATVGRVTILTNHSAVTVMGTAHVSPYQTFTVWLVDVSLNPDGTIGGCAGYPIAGTVSAGGNGVVRFQGSVARYPGEYDEQVIIGDPFGSLTGYATPITSVTVP